MARIHAGLPQRLLDRLVTPLARFLDLLWPTGQVVASRRGGMDQVLTKDLVIGREDPDERQRGI